MESSGRLPEGLAEMPPGPELAAVLAAVDPAVLNGHELVIVASVFARMVAHYQAGLAGVLDQLAHSPAGDADAAPERVQEPSGWAPVEVAAGLGWSTRRAALELRYAGQLVRRLPNVHAAWVAGRIDQMRARAFVDGLVGLEDAAARAEAGALLAAGAGGWDLRRLTDRLRRRVIAGDPLAAGRRLALRLGQRRLLTRRHPEGTVDLCGLDLPPHRVAEISERVTAIARAARRGGDPRGIDQLKADVFADLLAGTGIGATPAAAITHQGPLPHPYTEHDGTAHYEERAGRDVHAGRVTTAGERDEHAGQATTAGEQVSVGARSAEGRRSAVGERPGSGGPAVVALPGPRRGVLELTAPLSMLIGLSRAPGTVAGYGPVVADILRQIVLQDPSLRWRYSIYDDIDGDGQLAFHGIVHSRPAPTGPVSTRTTFHRPASTRPASTKPTSTAPPSSRPAATTPASNRPAPTAPRPSRPTSAVPGSRRPDANRPTSTGTTRSGPAGAAPIPGSGRDRDGFSAADAAFLRARDRTCRGPQGCPVPASACELDHTIAKMDGGGHDRGNGGALCSREHHFKHESGAQLHQPQPGVFEWITPLGHRYTITPERYDESTGPPEESTESPDP